MSQWNAGGDNPNGYWDAIVAKHSATLTEEESLKGETLISIESDSSQQQADLLIYSDQQPEGFFKLLRHLSPIEQEQLISYYVLAATQTRLAPIWKSTQTILSYLLRRATKTFCAALVFGEKISQQQIQSVLEAAGLESQLIKTRFNAETETVVAQMSVIFYDYMQCKSFVEVADRYELHRADMRRKMNQTAHLLSGENLDGTEAAVGMSPESLALGAVLVGLLDGANPIGAGKNPRASRKTEDVTVSDPPIVGQFALDLNDPNVKSMFISTANR